MTTYARVIDGVVAQIIPAIFGPDGQEVPLNMRFAVEVLEQIFVYSPRPEPEPEPEPTLAELVARAKVEIRAQRQPIIEILDGLQVSALTLGLVERAQAIEVAKAGLRDLTDLPLYECTTYEEMRLLVKVAYAALVADLPVDIRQAFSGAVS